MWAFFAIVCLVAPNYTFSQETDECKCVAHFLCDRDTRTIIDNGRGIIAYGERFGGVCTCDCPEDKVCCRLVNPVTTPAPPITCGVRNPDGVGFKSGGDIGDTSSNKVLLGEFPWFVDILVNSGAHRCGGSLIHPSVVLTAAHCVVRKQTYIVRAGDLDNSVTNEILKHQDRIVSSIKIHENYNPAVFYNDIALLFLNGSFNFNNSGHIQPACLAPSDASLGTERCFVIGRGKDEKGEFQNIPKKMDLPLVDKNTCQTKMRPTLTQNFNLYRSFLCAGGEKGKDSCIGDGGGPLVCPIADEEDKYQQIGIVSWGIGCHKEEMPAVYTSVPFLREWIDKEMKKKDLDINHYIYSI